MLFICRSRAMAEARVMCSSLQTNCHGPFLRVNFPRTLSVLLWEWTRLETTSLSYTSHFRSKFCRIYTQYMTVSMAPEAGLEPATRRLIPTSRDSNTEQVFSDPTRRFHALYLPLASHG